ncbi:Thermonuclease precursor [Mesomycoplasma neurolyticum]|uniref:Thermonuclease n=1 Tax=Mesomycoplasma neurolyticum TaxID=2120 RepID=A0A449A609_9BACT|nr:Thermonuclease precursor [Mesomycoplasma neurolyticum]
MLNLTQKIKRKSKKILKFFVFIFFFIFAFFAYSCENLNKFQEQPSVISEKYNIYDHEVIDGDTLKIKLTFETKTLRIYGIDTPEMNIKGSNPKEPTKGEKRFYAEKAKHFLKMWTKKHTNFQYKQIAKDKYGRIVAKLYDENNDFATEILKEGLAIFEYISLDQKDKYYTKDKNYFNQLVQAQKFAMQNQKGFWNKYNSVKKIKKVIY